LNGDAPRPGEGTPSTDWDLLLDDKAIVITGAGSGLAAATAHLAAREGARLVLADVDRDGLDSVVGELGHAAVAVPCDVTDLAAAARLVDTCVDQYGRVDGLVNAAGIMDTRQVLDIEPHHFDRLFDVNVRALFFLMQQAARRMVEQQSGSVVNFSSTAGRYPRPIASHYAATKAAVLSLTRSAAMALAPDGVRVNCVCPGLIETPMIDGIRRARSAMLNTTSDAIDDHWKGLIPMGRLGTAAEVAEAVAFLLSDRASYITGEALGVTGGTDAS